MARSHPSLLMLYRRLHPATASSAVMHGHIKCDDIYWVPAGLAFGQCLPRLSCGSTSMLYVLGATFPNKRHCFQVRLVKSCPHYWRWGWVIAYFLWGAGFDLRMKHRYFRLVPRCSNSYLQKPENSLVQSAEQSAFKFLQKFSMFKYLLEIHVCIDCKYPAWQSILV